MSKRKTQAPKTPAPAPSEISDAMAKHLDATFSSLHIGLVRIAAEVNDAEARLNNARLLAADTWNDWRRVSKGLPLEDKVALAQARASRMGQGLTPAGGITFADEADILTPSEISDGTSKVVATIAYEDIPKEWRQVNSHVPMNWFLMTYRCYECHHEFEDEWDSQIDSDCPRCHAKHVVAETVETVSVEPPVHLPKPPQAPTPAPWTDEHVDALNVVFERGDAWEEVRRQKYIAAARSIYADRSNDDIEIDYSDVKTSEGDEGMWVQAWVWVSNEQVEED